MNTKPTTLRHPAASEKKINNLLDQTTITPEDIKDLNQMERERLGEKATLIVNQLTGEARDNFIEKIERVLHPTNSNVWEYNQLVISKAVADFMGRYGVMPTAKAIAEQTGISRQTVAKHIKEYRRHPEFLAEMEQFKFMGHNILAKVFKFASDGDMRAARLYFEMIGALDKRGSNVVNEQNNYIQINNTILSQENLKQLSQEQLAQIESIVANRELKVMR